jgi:hypothetical protein
MASSSTASCAQRVSRRSRGLGLGAVALASLLQVQCQEPDSVAGTPPRQRRITDHGDAAVSSESDASAGDDPEHQHAAEHENEEERDAGADSTSSMNGV